TPPPQLSDKPAAQSLPSVPQPQPALPSLEDIKPAATTDPGVKAAPSIDPGKNISAQRKPLPPLQYVNNPEVTVDYELNRVGPSGIGSVELWWTQDNGESWKLYAYDDKIVGATENGRHQRTVELPGEGVYGLTLVVKSKAGLGRSAPHSGDVPEMLLEVDTTA